MYYSRKKVNIMKLKKIASKVKQETVGFFKDPKKVQGLAIGIVGTLTAALLVDEVKTSKHKKEVKELKNHYLDFGYGEERNMVIY